MFIIILWLATCSQNENLSFEVKSSLANSALVVGAFSRCWYFGDPLVLAGSRNWKLHGFLHSVPCLGTFVAHGVMTAQVLRKAGFLPVQLQLRIERINFAARLFRKAPEELRRLAASENRNDTNTWYGLLSQDLQHMATVMRKELAAMPTYSSHPEQWHKLWVDFPGAWKLLVKRYAQRLRESLSTLYQVECAEDAQVEYGSSEHQIVKWPCTWPEFMECKDVHRVNVVFITSCDLCTTCLTQARCVLEWCMLHTEPMTVQDR